MLGFLISARGWPRNRATLISMSWRSLGSSRQSSSHQSGKIADRKNSFVKPAFDNRLVKLLKVCFGRGMLRSLLNPSCNLRPIFSVGGDIITISLRTLCTVKQTGSGQVIKGNTVSGGKWQTSFHRATHLNQTRLSLISATIYEIGMFSEAALMCYGHGEQKRARRRSSQ